VSEACQQCQALPSRDWNNVMTCPAFRLLFKDGACDSQSEGGKSLSSPPTRGVQAVVTGLDHGTWSARQVKRLDAILVPPAASDYNHLNSIGLTRGSTHNMHEAFVDGCLHRSTQTMTHVIMSKNKQSSLPRRVGIGCFLWWLCLTQKPASHCHTESTQSSVIVA